METYEGALRWDDSIGARSMVEFLDLTLRGRAAQTLDRYLHLGPILFFDF